MSLEPGISLLQWSDLAGGDKAISPVVLQLKRRIGKKAEQHMNKEKSSIKWRMNSRTARVMVTTGTMAAAALTMAAPFRWASAILGW